MKDPYFPGGAGEDQSARALLDAIKQVASAGRGGDELLAYLSPESIQALMSMGGAGTINPVTSLPEFKSGTTQQKVTPPVTPPAAPAPATVVLPRPSDQLRRLIEAQPAINAWRESLGSFDDSGRLAGINPVVPASAMGSQGIAVRPVAAPVFGQSAGVAPGAFVSRGINIQPISMPSLPSLGQMASPPSLQNGISTPYLAPYIPQAPAMSRIEMAPMGFAKGGEADVDDMQALADAYDSEDEEAADTDPVGSAQAMLAQLQASDTPSARPMPRLRTSSGGASRPKEMGSEYESLTTARAPEPKGAKSAQAELRALARSLELKRIAAENDARALMRNTLGAPTLRRPGLTKASLSVQRFEKGGEAKKNEPGSELWRQIPTDDVPRTAARAPKPAPAKGIVDRAAEIGRRVGFMAKGVTELPYDLAGGAVDLATLAMRPFGYKTEAPVMGSDWIKQKATELGIRPEPPKDFGDRAFFTAGEVLSGFANPATVARRVGPAVEKAVRAGATQVGKQLDRAMMEGTGPLSGVVSQAARPIAAAPSGPGAGPIFSPTPMAESPFVGRIDQFAAALPGPVRKDQLLGQLKTKFRDYEVGRAEEALADLDAANKVTPGDLLNRLRNTYDPSTYKTQIIEPEQGLSGENYQSYDNPYRDKSLGVIHLIQTELPEVPEKARALKALRTKMLDSTFRTGALEPEELAGRLSNIRQSLQGASPTAVTEVENTFASFAKANDDYVTFSNLADDVLYPGSSTTFDRRKNRILEEIFRNNPTTDPFLAGQIAKKRAMEDDVREGIEKLATQFDLPQLRPYADSLVARATINVGVEQKSLLDQAREDVRELLKQAGRTYRDAVSQANEQLRGSLRAAYPRGEGRAYTGQHSSLGNEPNPIAFSRFSEHTATIPGLGKVKGIYVNELQSDRLDDIRKSGPLGGSAQKDLETLYKPSLDRLATLAQQYNETNAQAGFPRSEAVQEALNAISNEMERVSEKVNKIGQRMRTGTYELKESFPGMENSPQVIQQLMAKNVIAAAVNRGDSFVAFPGAESAQSQLYEKLERNLKQVVKDLGPGFEYTQITLPAPAGGEPMMHKAVIWGPEGAARLKKQGVPFKDGGLVDKNTAFIKAHA